LGFPDTGALALARHTGNNSGQKNKQINEGRNYVGRETPKIWRGLLLAWALNLTAASDAATISTHVTTGDGTPIPYSVVTITPAGQGPIAVKPGAQAIMLQEGKQFIPFVLPVQLGTVVQFPNRDPFRHQVYSFAPAKTFELKLYGGTEVGTVMFDKEGAVPLGCNIHDNMLAYIYVVGTPYFSTTGAQGESKIEQLPAGAYTVKVWHPNQRGGGAVTQDIKVAATDNTSLTLQIELKRTRGQRKPGAVDENQY
jgi:plastocyanin